MNKHELAKKINELEGLTNEEKSELLKLLRSQKKYGLVWEDKPEDAELRMVNEQPVLVEVPERAIVSDDAEAPNHILIEGDNLEALTALSYTHSGKIDVIYIDPPYNTGNKDFTYNDDYVDKEDSFKHTKWISFMSKRLRVAKSLLSEKGVLFISIDDNEQAALKLLCDEIFGEEHFIGNIVWFKKRKGSFLSNKLVSLTEYILSYSKYDGIKLFGGLPDNSESQPIIKRTNSKKVLSFDAGVVKSKLPNGIYEAGLYGNGSSASRLLNSIEVKDGYIITPFEIEAPFVWGQSFVEQEIKNGTEFLVNTKNFQVRVIRHNNTSVKAFPSFLDGRDFNATNEDAYELLKTIFNEDSPFRYSKPVNLIAKILLSNSYDDKDITILDFFAGSGTTLHATMQLNAEDGGHRQCILVTNNENGICENVTYERNRRVIQGYTTPKGEEVPGLTRNNLRYYKTKFVPRDKSPKNLRRLMELSTDMLCIHNDTYIEKPFAGKRINNKIARYFESNNGSKRMLVIYLDEAIQAIVELIKQEISKEEKKNGNDTVNSKVEVDKKAKLMVYVFSPNGYAYDDEFEEVADYVSLCAMPDAVLNAYRRVLPKRKQVQLLDDVEEDTESENRTTEELDLFQTQNYAMAASEIHEPREEMKYNNQNTEEGGEA